jgi:SAM-dependent methyltransferase
MNPSTTWASEFFSGLFVEFWLACTSEPQTKQEADFLEEVLQAPPSAKFLDLACGGGRHCHELAARGYAMTGVDLSAEFLAHARRGADEKKLAIQWQQRPITNLTFHNEFDGAYIMGNSLGGLDDAGHLAFFRGVARALKPGARFVIDTGVIAESILPTIKDHPRWQIGEFTLIVNNVYDHAAARLNMDFTIQRGSQTEQKAGFSQVYLYRDFCGRLEAAGFSEMIGYSTLTQEPYRLGSPRLLLVARRTTAL